MPVTYREPTKQANGDPRRARIAERLRKVEGLFKNRSEAAQAAAVSKTAFQHWAEGKADPSFSRLARLADAANVSLDWLATGTGPMFREGSSTSDTNKQLAPIVESLPTILQGLRRIFDETHVELTPLRLFEALVAIADDLAGVDPGRDSCEAAVKVSLKHLRRRLKRGEADNLGT